MRTHVLEGLLYDKPKGFFRSRNLLYAKWRNQQSSVVGTCVTGPLLPWFTFNKIYWIFDDFICASGSLILYTFINQMHHLCQMIFANYLETVRKASRARSMLSRDSFNRNMNRFRKLPQLRKLTSSVRRYKKEKRKKKNCEIFCSIRRAQLFSNKPENLNDVLVLMIEIWGKERSRKRERESERNRNVIHLSH